ncbi:MAG: glycosyltransferase family 39 protein, partial [Bacteroidota bacterium]|nr:glycosyltransferase family 39 protein [Bacteroidota bacterium]
MMKYIQKYWTKNPLMVIMVLAIFVRLLAVIFAKGFGMHDDHFLVIEPPQSWLDGHNFDYWLPSPERGFKPNGSSLLYPGFHFAFFYILKQLHIIDPQVKMFLLRFITAAFSLITVFYGYKITEKISNKKSANTVGLLLAVFWMMPWLSVRNLVEIVCIPFMMYSVWIVLRQYDKPKPIRWFFLAGLLLGIAFSIRYQTIFFTGGLGLAVLFDKKWREMFAMAFGCLISITVVQCTPDMIMWGYPFAEFQQYIKYNIDNRFNYPTGSFFKYFEFLLGVIIVPMGLYLFYG